jgi:dCMP deaminase
MNDLDLFAPNIQASQHADSVALWEIKKATAMLKTIACLASFNSKDPNTKVGAMIVRPNFSFVSQGYNGLTIGMPDSDEIWKNEDPKYKYSYVQHAERNAIAFSHGVDVFGCYAICNLYPCNECAGLLIQAGIAKVFYSASKRRDHKSDVADEMFNAALVTRVRIPGYAVVKLMPEFDKAPWD